MNRVFSERDWPESWLLSYRYDLQEIYGEIRNPGYVYAYQNRRDVTFRLIEEVLPKGSTILDVAAAQGNFTLSLAERGYRVTWNDLRHELEGYVRLKHEHGEVTFAPGNVFELGLGPEFDCVLITEIIEHVAHPDEFLRSVSSMVKPGGYIVMTTPNGAYFRNKLARFSECADPSIYEAVQFKPDSDAIYFFSGRTR
jgi:2-polyprenyl-3-methyl-5-hydroxy-6-metoxy-1,4-benzoquinol methylase